MKKDLAIALLFASIILILLLSNIIDLEARQKVEETGSIELYFCIIENCTGIIYNELLLAKDINCAFYTLRHHSLTNLIINKEVGLVLHEKSNTRADNNAIIRTIRAPRLWGLMHNKFCTYTKEGNEYVLTGSYNPSGPEKKHDLILIISSEALHYEYLKEHSEMRQGIFAGGKKIGLKEILFITQKNEELYELTIIPAFCPEDNCEQRIIEIIEEAKENIIMLSYTFTSEPIGDALIRAKDRGVQIEIYADRGARGTQSSQIGRMEDKGIKIIIVPQYMMHHKTTIIDSTLITGSMNYGKNANTRNDENILIIKDPQRLLINEITHHVSSII